MKTLLLQIFTWWSGQTIGVRFHTWRHGERVGEDANGNVYYQGGTDSEGRTRRWVIYNGPSEPSLIPPGWHGWMHHRTDVAPASETYAAKAWEQPHQPNLTGTARAYRPKGSILNQGARPTVTGDYDAWTPKSLKTVSYWAQPRHNFMVNASLTAVNYGHRRRCPATAMARAMRREKRMNFKTMNLARSAAALILLAAVAGHTPASAARIENPVAVFSGIDKITGRITTFDVYVGETVQFGALQVTPRICYSRDETEPPKTTTFVEVDEITLDRKIRRLFTGWMFADSPGLNAVDHAVYDVWLKECKQQSDVPAPTN